MGINVGLVESLATSERLGASDGLFDIDGAGVIGEIVTEFPALNFFTIVLDALVVTFC